MTSAETRQVIHSAETVDETFLGSRESTLGITEHITLPDEARVTHVLNVGPTGYGKTQLMLHTALQDAVKGHGFCVVNPKGGAITELIAKLPEDRQEDVVYISPGRDEITPINVLEPHVTGDMTPAQVENQKEIIVSDLIDLFRRFSENWGDRFGRVLETLFRAHIDLNLQGDSKTLLDVFRCVVNDEALTDLIDNTEDMVVREQLVRVKEDMSSYEMEPLQRRLNDFVMNPTVRRFIAAEESGVDLRNAINENAIILVDVQKGEVGDMVARLVGSIVITKVWAATQSRITIPEAEREPFYLYIDELQNFAGEGSNFTKILSEAREYRLGCWLATQYLHQLAPEMRRAVTNNCRTKILFNPAGSEDLSQLTSMLTGVDRTTLTQLGKYRAVLQQPSEGQYRDAVTFDTYPPWTADTEPAAIERVKHEATYSTPLADTQLAGTSLGQTANAGGETHTELLQAVHDHFTDEGCHVNLLYQDAGSDRPDGHVMDDGELRHLEAEASTLTKPVKVLRNWQRACEADRDVVFVVEAGNGTKLANILSDPVNRRGSDAEDDTGTFSYYTDEDGTAFTAVGELDGDYEIYEVRAGEVMQYDAETEAECPALEHSPEEELEVFCLHREEDGYCTALGMACVLQE